MHFSKIALVVAAFAVVAAGARAQEIVTVSPRAGTTLSLLLIVPASGKPTAGAVLFTGGPGVIRLRNENGSIRFGEGNFLVRSRELFVERGIAAAIVDAPSDQARGMDDRFRLGEAHAADIVAVVDQLRQRFDNIPIFLVGTSRGTISAAATAGPLGNNVAGVVLTSTLFLATRAQPGLSGFDYTKIKVPVLLVHHADDACNVTPDREARKLADNRNYPLITVHGGKPPTSDPCEAVSAHGYLGKEPETVDAVVQWMLKKPYPTNIN